MATDNNTFEVIQTDDGEVLIHNLQDDTYSVLTDTIRVQAAAEQSSSTLSGSEVSGSDCTKTERSNVWSKSHTLFLLEKYKLKREDFENPRFKKIDLFKDIAKMLQSEMGTEFTPVQCQNRLKTLYNKYKSIRDHNNTSGKERRDWEYFDQIADIIGDKLSVVPVASCSSLGLATSNQSENETEQKDQTQNCKKRKIEKRATPKGELQKFLQQYKLEQNEKERQRLEVMERHHTENKAVLEKLIEALKD